MTSVYSNLQKPLQVGDKSYTYFSLPDLNDPRIAKLPFSTYSSDCKIFSVSSKKSPSSPLNFSKNSLNCLTSSCLIKNSIHFLYRGTDKKGEPNKTGAIWWQESRERRLPENESVGEEILHSEDRTSQTGWRKIEMHNENTGAGDWNVTCVKIRFNLNWQLLEMSCWKWRRTN